MGREEERERREVGREEGSGDEDPYTILEGEREGAEYASSVD